jgi:hypothetical protein
MEIKNYLLGKIFRIVLLRFYESVLKALMRRLDADDNVMFLTD